MSVLEHERWIRQEFVPRLLRQGSVERYRQVLPQPPSLPQSFVFVPQRSLQSRRKQHVHGKYKRRQGRQGGRRENHVHKRGEGQSGRTRPEGDFAVDAAAAVAIGVVVVVDSRSSIVVVVNIISSSNTVFIMTNFHNLQRCITLLLEGWRCGSGGCTDGSEGMMIVMTVAVCTAHTMTTTTPMTTAAAPARGVCRAAAVLVVGWDYDNARWRLAIVDVFFVGITGRVVVVAVVVLLLLRHHGERHGQVCLYFNMGSRYSMQGSIVARMGKTFREE